MVPGAVAIASGMKGSGNLDLINRFVSAIISREFIYFFSRELEKTRHSWGQNLKIQQENKKYIRTKLRIPLSMKILIRQREPGEQEFEGWF